MNFNAGVSIEDSPPGARDNMMRPRPPIQNLDQLSMGIRISAGYSQRNDCQGIRFIPLTNLPLKTH